MCIETLRSYQSCSHRTYRSTYVCDPARGPTAYADNVLLKTKFLPERPPTTPRKCTVKKAISPSTEACPICAKQEREKRMVDAKAASQPARNMTPVRLQEQRFNESPGPQAAERVRNSLLFLEQYRKFS